MDDPAAPPAAPATPDATPPAPAPDAPAPDAGASAAEERSRKLRFQAKVAGVMLMLFGALFTFQFAYGAAVASQRSTWEKQHGGTIEWSLQGNATVTVQYPNGTVESKQLPRGNSTMDLAWAVAHVTVTTDGRTYQREVVLPPNAHLPIAIGPDSPPSESVGVDPAGYRILWAVAIVPALATVGGFFAFRVRAPRIALAGAFVFLMGTAYLVVAGGPDLLTLALLGTAILCFVFIYKARAEFAPRPA